MIETIETFVLKPSAPQWMVYFEPVSGKIYHVTTKNEDHKTLAKININEDNVRDILTSMKDYLVVKIKKKYEVVNIKNLKPTKEKLSKRFYKAKDINLINFTNTYLKTNNDKYTGIILANIIKDDTVVFYFTKKNNPHHWLGNMVLDTEKLMKCIMENEPYYLEKELDLANQDIISHYNIFGVKNENT
jgi:hypothetical protein